MGPQPGVSKIVGITFGNYLRLLTKTGVNLEIFPKPIFVHILCLMALGRPYKSSMDI